MNEKDLALINGARAAITSAVIMLSDVKDKNRYESSLKSVRIDLLDLSSLLKEII